MYGLAAIQQANGWAMAGTGACIVLSGLAILATLISLVPHLTGLFEPKAAPAPVPQETETTPSVQVPDKLPDDLNDACTIFMDISETLGDEFTLEDLHRRCREVNVAHPHFSINRFRDAGVLISCGEGFFCWKPKSE